MCGTVRIVFNTLYSRRNTIFVTFEVYDTIVLFMTTTNVTSCNVTIVVTTTSTFLSFNQRSIRSAFVKMVVNDFLYKATSWRRWLTFLNRHNFRPYSAALSAVSPKSAISTSWPAFRVTYAFLTSERRPNVLPKLF